MDAPGVGATGTGGGVGYNYTQGYGGNLSLLDSSYRNTTQPAAPTRRPVVGTFSLGLWLSGSGIPLSISPVGDIPADARSLLFLYHGNNLTVYVGGVPTWVHFAEDGASGDPEAPLFHYFAVDVSAFAGQTAELRFEFLSVGNPRLTARPLPVGPSSGCTSSTTSASVPCPPCRNRKPGRCSRSAPSPSPSLSVGKSHQTVDRSAFGGGRNFSQRKNPPGPET